MNSSLKLLLEWQLSRRGGDKQKKGKIVPRITTTISTVSCVLSACDQQQSNKVTGQIVKQSLLKLS